MLEDMQDSYSLQEFNTRTKNTNHFTSSVSLMLLGTETDVASLNMTQNLLLTQGGLQMTEVMEAAQKSAVVLSNPLFRQKVKAKIQIRRGG
jgi:hypothetical protein